MDARNNLQEMIAAEADRRCGPQGWRAVNVTFSLPGGNMEMVRVVNRRAPKDDEETTDRSSS